MSMKRGSKFFSEFTSVNNVVAGSGGKGRSAKLIASRNDKIAHRYYYYSRLLQYNYEVILAMLVNEFDLSEFTIIWISTKNANLIKKIGDEKPTKTQLKKKYPYFDWNNKAAVTNITSKKKEQYNGY
jgi:hypothetical protein